MSVDFSTSHKAMDPREHERTYRGFVKATGLVVAFCAATLVLMAIFLV